MEKKKNKKLKITLIILIPLILIGGVIGAFFIYVGNYYHAVEYTHNEEVEITSYNGYNLYSKKNVEASSLYIFYPGALVEDKAYQGLAETIALENIDVAVVSMPFNLAFFGMNKANDVIGDLPHYGSYYLGGHSLGGAMAGSYESKDTSNKIKGMILLASYVTSKQPSLVECLTIRGSEDKVLKSDKYEENRNYFSSKYVEYTIPGGNHGNFGNYGHQSGDGEASITNEEQWKITAKLIKEFVSD